jgi:Cys-tRNA(Pro)/Cys-tRNA(Cys) deacylase
LISCGSNFTSSRLKAWKESGKIEYQDNIPGWRKWIMVMIQNNITRLLEARRIPHQVFELPNEKLGALETSRLLGVPPETVYKTIVMTRPKGKPILAVIPGSHRVDLKLLAAALGEKKISPATEREAEELTGLKAGGISPLALINKGFQVVIALEACSLHEVQVSGGQRGLNIRLPVSALADLTRARFALISLVESDHSF